MLHLYGMYRLKKSSELIIVRLFLAFALAAIDTVWVLYMNSLGLSNSAIGFVTSILIIISLIVLITSTPILERFNESKILLYSILFSIISFILLYIKYISIFLHYATC